MTEVPQPGIILGPLPEKAQSLSHWTAREFSQGSIKSAFFQNTQTEKFLNLLASLRDILDQRSANFFVNDQKRNNFHFVSHMLFVAAPQVFHCSVKADIENM